MQVAFFRNLNLGQPRSPRRVQLVDAFAGLGASDVLSHQSNGTVAFTCAGDPQLLADDVAVDLGPLCQYADVVLVRSVAWLSGLGLDALPDGCELTLFDIADAFPEPLPWDPGHGDVTVVAADDRHALVRNHVERRSNGTPVIERRLGVPATSRGVGTIQRLLARIEAL